MTADNLSIWNTLSKTDPKATKPFTRSGGFKGTQIDPVWRQKMMTEMFGPVGEGWGYEVQETRVESGMVFCLVRAWYIPPGQKAEFNGGTAPANARWTGPQWGGTEIMAKRSGNSFADDECFKKSVTDGLGKCLLQLGVAADVHTGQFDDSKYRDEVTREYEQKRKEDAPSNQNRTTPRPFDTGPLEASGPEDWAQKFAARVAAAPSLDALNAFVANNEPTLGRLKADLPEQAARLITAIASRRHDFSQAPMQAAE